MTCMMTVSPAIIVDGKVISASASANVSSLPAFRSAMRATQADGNVSWLETTALNEVSSTDGTSSGVIVSSSMASAMTEISYDPEA